MQKLRVTIKAPDVMSRRSPVPACCTANGRVLPGCLPQEQARRLLDRAAPERYRMVVHNSGRLGEIEIADGGKEGHGFQPGVKLDFRYFPDSRTAA